MKEAEQLCDRVAFMKKGEIIANARPDALKRQLKLGETISIEYAGTLEIAALNNIPGILNNIHSKGKIRIAAEDVETLLDRILKEFSDVHIKSIEISQPRLLGACPLNDTFYVQGTSARYPSQTCSSGGKSPSTNSMQEGIRTILKLLYSR